MLITSLRRRVRSFLSAEAARVSGSNEPRARPRGERLPDFCSQLSSSDEASDLRQILARDVDQKEGGFNTVALCKILIRAGHCRDQLAAATKDLE